MRSRLRTTIGLQAELFEKQICGPTSPQANKLYDPHPKTKNKELAVAKKKMLLFFQKWKIYFFKTNTSQYFVEFSLYVCFNSS